MTLRADVLGRGREGMQEEESQATSAARVSLLPTLGTWGNPHNHQGDLPLARGG